MSKPKILLLSAYDTPSHNHWCRVLTEKLTQFDWTTLILPARYYAWRVKGNSLTWGVGDFPELLDDYHLIIATSMVDITSLRGFRPNLAKVPLMVYFHENQFDYPVSAQQKDDIHIKLLSIYNAVCADRVLFNSDYNRNTFLEGAAQLLKKMPDHVPGGLLHRLNSSSQVLPVPIDLTRLETRAISPGQPLKIVWNHRWEYDKNPEAFFQALMLLKQQNIPFKLAVMGQTFRNSPPIFEEARNTLSAHITHWGYQSSDDHFDCLSRSDLVVSTAWHDFQGLALQEAMALGCVPVCPNRVAYPEYVPQQLLYNNSTDKDAEHLAQKLTDIHRLGFDKNINSIEQFGWDSLKEPYTTTVNALIDS